MMCPMIKMVRSLLIVMVLLLNAPTLNYATSDILYGGKHDSEIKKIIIDTSKQINSQLPMMVDENTRFDLTMTLNKQIHYKYTMVNLLLDTLDSDAFEVNQREFLVSNQCRNKNMVSLLKLGIEYFYMYFDKEGNVITSIKIDQSSCEL